MKKSFNLSVFIIFIAFFFGSCTNKKERLTDNTSGITIDPSIVKVFNDGISSKQLKALCRDARNKEVAIEPEWSVEPSSLGEFGIPTTGKTATFVAGTTESTGKIYASYAGLRGVA